MESQFNNTKQYLGSQETWSGLPEVTTNFSNVAVNIVSNHNLSVQVYQSLDGRTFDFRDDYIFNTSIVGTQTTFQTGIKALYYKVVVTNISVNNIDNLVITSTFFNTSRDSSLLQPDIIAGSVSVLNSIKATDYTFNIPRNVACDSSGHLLVSASTPSGTQDVNILSSINLSVTPPHLSYLTDNVAVATMPAITGTVSVSSQPHLSYLTDNIAVATMPALVFATDKVDVTGSSVVVSSQPHLSYLTDNIAVTTQPALVFSTDKVDVSGSSISVSSGAITETNSGSIKTATEAINTKITACNTGSVIITSQPHLSYLTDNVAVATMPAITGTVAISSQPYLSYLTDNIAVATQPALTFATDKVDISGSSVSVSSGTITETNSGSIKTAVEAINSKITACNTGAVVISSQSKTTSSVTTWENPSSVISFDSNGAIPQNIKASSGSLISMSVFNNASGNAIGYLAIYDELAANVTVGVTIPKMVLALNHNVSIEIPCHNLQFSNGISYYVATTYSGAIHLSGIYLTAFYDN